MNVSNIKEREKGVRLIAEQGKSNLTLSSSYMKMIIDCGILRDNVIA
jgi:hypothetical protein